MGTYTKVAALTRWDRPVYRRVGSAVMYLYYWLPASGAGYWNVGPSYTVDSAFVSSYLTGVLCPQQQPDWSVLSSSASQWVDTYPVTVVDPCTLTVPAACSGTVTLAASATPVVITDGAGDYPPNANCVWTITASGPITLRFSAFAIETGSDFLEVYDGASTSSPTMFSLVALPAVPITSTGGALTISFTSNGAIQAAGFVASVSTSAAVPAVPASSLQLVGAVPAQQISGLACAGRIRTLYDALPTRLDSSRPRISAFAPRSTSSRGFFFFGRDLSGQLLNGTLPDSLSEMTGLTSMCVAG